MKGPTSLQARLARLEQERSRKAPPERKLSKKERDSLVAEALAGDGHPDCSALRPHEAAAIAAAFRADR